jgi:hypothetical protein
MRALDPAGWMLAVTLVAMPAAAFTPEEVEVASGFARQVEADLRALADDAFEGRGSGAAGGELAREYLIDQLQTLGDGLGPGLGRDAYEQPFDEGTRSNLLAVIPGTQPDAYVMVGAHYDHFAPGACFSLGGGDTICNGAADDATGVAAVLAIGRAVRALPGPPARSVVLALWDGEEHGLLGSRHFATNPLIPLAEIAAYVNFDIQGSNLTPSAREVSFAIGAESGGEVLIGATLDAIARVGLDTQLLTVTFGQARSDYQPFWSRGVPIVFFSDATNACYHTTEDEVEVVDLRKLRRQSEIGFRLALAVAESVAPPVYQPLAALDTYEDLLVLSDFLTRSLADLDLLDPFWAGELVDLEALARARVNDGPEGFSPTDALTIAQSALDIALNGLPCDPAILPEPQAGAALALATLAAFARRRRASRSRVVAAVPIR